MFTATMENSVLKLAEKMLRDPQRIELAVRTSSHALIEQRLHVADNLNHKKELLRHLVNDGKLTRAIIFSATKRDADALAIELSRNGHPAAALHGDMNQNARNKTIEKMRRGGIRLLVATDVAARGLDVNGISHVINFDLPRFAEDYVHRIGRTGRAGATGVAISFVSSSELNYLERIERFIGKKLPEQNIEGLAPLSVLRRISSGNGARRPGAPGRPGSSRFAKPAGKSNGAKPQGSKPWSNASKPAAGGRSQRGTATTSQPVVEYRTRRAETQTRPN
jgi:superfamily II DNA/RNA helicase